MLLAATDAGMAAAEAADAAVDALDAAEAEAEAEYAAEAAMAMCYSLAKVICAPAIAGQIQLAAHRSSFISNSSHMSIAIAFRGGCICRYAHARHGLHSKQGGTDHALSLDATRPRSLTFYFVSLPAWRRQRNRMFPGRPEGDHRNLVVRRPTSPRLSPEPPRAGLRGELIHLRHRIALTSLSPRDLPPRIAPPPHLTRLNRARTMRRCRIGYTLKATCTATNTTVSAMSPRDQTYAM